MVVQITNYIMGNIDQLKYTNTRINSELMIISYEKPLFFLLILCKLYYDRMYTCIL